MVRENTNLYKVMNIFDNLEENYKSSHCKTRDEYIRYITQVSGKDNKIYYIINCLKEEVESYNKEEIDEYTRILKLLNGLNIILTSPSGFIVNSFEELLNDCTHKQKLAENSVIITDKFIEELSIYRKCEDFIKTNPKTLDEIYNETGFLGDCTIFKDNKPKTYNLADNHAILINYIDTELISKLDALKSENILYKYTLIILKYLFNNNMFKAPMIIIDNKYLKRKGKLSGIIEIGDYQEKMKMNSKNRIEEMDMVAYYTTIQLNNISYFIVGIDAPSLS